MPQNTAAERGENDSHQSRYPQPRSYSNSRRVADILRAESVGGTVLLIATVLAVVLANTPASTFYFGLRDTVVGPVIPGFNHLQMSIGTWAADGLLVVFFFLTGLELKKES